MSARRKLPGLDATRFYAASAIVFFHLIGVGKVAVPESLSFVGVYFGFAVPLFYIVSAFGLFVGYSGRLENPDQLRDYYWRRYFRIAPFFYFMIVFYVVLTWGLYGRTIPLEQILSSALFIFNFIPQHVTGFVLASWSIGVEMAFYAILPILIFAITGFWRAILFFVLSVFITFKWMAAFQGLKGVLAQFASFSLVAHMLYFAAGIVAFFLLEMIWRQSNERARQWAGAGSIAGSLFTMFVLIYFSKSIGNTVGSTMGYGYLGIFSKVAWGIALAWFVLGICLAPLRILVNQVTQVLGKISFSLYLWHPLMIGFLRDLSIYEWIYQTIDNVVGAFLMSAVATFAVLIPVAAATYIYIERPGMNLFKPRRRERV